MTIVVSGASGLIGSVLVAALRDDGEDRRHAGAPSGPRLAGEVRWMPDETPLDPVVIAGSRAVVALGGHQRRPAAMDAAVSTENCSAPACRPRARSPQRCVRSARMLRHSSPPRRSASTGRHQGRCSTRARPLERLSSPNCASSGRGRRSARGTRHPSPVLRTAPVIHRRGVLKPLVQLTRFGVSGPLGSGRQIWPWISLDDEVRAIRHVIDERVSGPVNLTGPAPASANDVGRALAERMRRPFWLPAPAWALRLGLSAAAADSLLLADADVRPRALERTGFRFTHPTVQEAVAAAV
ncbi:hypothetical protein HA402_006732 [Bradysia odoriphaga]|nr:hypothetical protein HA402_006732 [Bradysia odoriphaga]